jgi:SagB-type dehydrogenase family enzyme
MKQDPSIFIRIINGKLILWDYRAHCQYEVSSQHIQRILELVNGAMLCMDPIDAEIKRSKILDADNRDFSQWGWDCLSHIFHFGTQIVLGEGEQLPIDDGYEGYLAFCASLADTVPEMKYTRGGSVISLPPPDKEFEGSPNLIDSLKARKTSRSFVRSPISLQLVSNSLYWTFGTVHGDTRQDMADAGLLPVGYRRTSPSGGSLHPSEAYLVALAVEGVPAGVYHYRSFSHQLTLVNPHIDGETIGSLLCAQMFARNLAFGVFVTSRFDKMWWKYPHSRAYRVALLDVGCLAQTFQLVTTALGMSSWLTGYFLDREVNKLLLVDEVQESVLFFLGAGNGNGSAFAEEALQALNQMHSLQGAGEA